MTTTYRVTYLGPYGEFLNKRLATCGDHWEACEFAWKHMPKRAADFNVEEETFSAEVPAAISTEEIIQVLDDLKSRIQAARS